MLTRRSLFAATAAGGAAIAAPPVFGNELFTPRDIFEDKVRQALLYRRMMPNVGIEISSKDLGPSGFPTGRVDVLPEGDDAKILHENFATPGGRLKHLSKKV